MNGVATLAAADRADLFNETGAQRGLPGALVEKDFWVSWTLLQLFTMEELKGHVVFKGGTALSKVFDAIRRFSEDVDLIIDYEMLGFTGDSHPSAQTSKRKRGILVERMLESCNAFIEGAFLAALRSRFTSLLGPSGWELRARRGTDGGAVVEFVYPKAVSQPLDYLSPFVLLEPGTNAELVPKGSYRIRPIAADVFPDKFKEPAATLLAITAERSFWEKATILHVEYHRPLEKNLPARYSRHYYDLAMLAGRDIRASALRDAELRKRVVKHKDEFYPSGWGRYDLAVPGTFSLSPRTERIEQLRRDYESMRVMIFGQPPTFDEILQTLKSLETEINQSVP